jgi:hypothetical protein
VIVDHEHRGDGVDDGDDAEDDERGPRYAPEAFPVRAERGSDDVACTRIADDLVRDHRLGHDCDLADAGKAGRTGTEPPPARPAIADPPRP